jgi:hypothetical protein
MIRIEAIQIIAARLAAELNSTKTVETSTPFRQQRMPQSCSPRPKQPSGPVGQEAAGLCGPAVGLIGTGVETVVDT